MGVRPALRLLRGSVLHAAVPILLTVVTVLLAPPSDPPPTRILSEPPPGAPAPFGPGPPATLVALSEKGTVELLDASSGGRLRTPGRHEAGSLQGVALAPDRRSAYYAVSSGCQGGVIYQVDLDRRSAPRPVARGVSPAVSPDGRHLAYAVSQWPASAGSGCPNVVVVRDLSNRLLRSWRHPDDELHRSGPHRGGSLTKLAWSPDSIRLALTVSYEGDSVSVLDTADDRDLSETEEVVVPGGGGDSRHPAWQGSSGHLAIVNRAFECCYEDDYQGPPRTVLVDVPDLRSEELLPVGLEPTWLDFDGSGDHLLYVEAGRLYRRSQGEEPSVVAHGISAADW